jgi:N-methylhydantoinase B
MDNVKMNDPILMEVIGNSLISIAEEMSVTIKRTAYSSIVREALDFSTALFDVNGDLIAQSDNIPTHLGSMGSTLKQILKNHYPISQIEDGDMLIMNHPYFGASHAPDILLFAPIFNANDLVGFCGSMCHHVDVGGSTPGSSPGDATEIFQEGLLIPPLKLYEKGTPNETLFAILRSNVRMPSYTLGDLRSQIAANQIGKKRMAELFQKYGIPKIKMIIAEWMRYSETQIRAKIKEIPDGIYVAEGHLDDDGVDKGKRIPIKARIEIQGDKVIFDFTESSPQVRGPFNVVKETVYAVALFVTRCISDYDVPQNEGAFRPIEVRVKKGTIFDPVFPAPVSGRYHTIMRLSDVCLEACAKALPDLIPASSHAHATTLAVGGMHPEMNSYFVYYELNGGGMGARPIKDGLSGIDVHVGNCMNVPVEAVELEYPLHIVKYELAPDSGGAGKYRGGLGLVRDLKMMADGLTVTVRSDGETTEPKGLAGGKNGLAGKKLLNPGTKEEQRIYGKASRLTLKKGDVISLQTPGSGGFGDPKERDRQKVLADWEDGYITARSLRETYGLEEIGGLEK